MTSRPRRVTSSETAPCLPSTVHWRNSQGSGRVVTRIVNPAGFASFGSLSRAIRALGKFQMCRVCHGGCVARLLRMKRRDSPHGRAQTQPTKRNGFFVIAFPPGTFYVGSCGNVFRSTIRRRPRLGSVVRSRHLTHPASGASATGPVSRRATSAPTHQADEPPSTRAPRERSRLVRTGSEGFPRRTT